jgi:diacylglycerol kinase (ATP)
MSSQGPKGIDRIIKAAGYSRAGFIAAFQNEAAFRQILALFVTGAPLGLWLGKTGMARALLVGSLFLLVIVELLNSAIEAIVDRIGPDHHELSGRAKDMGSAAQFTALVAAATVWALVLFG